MNFNILEKYDRILEQIVNAGDLSEAKELAVSLMELGLLVRDSSRYRTYFEELIAEQGGYFNAHAHLDRIYTYVFNHLNTRQASQAASSSLTQKQSNTGELHKSHFYSEESLYERMKQGLEAMVLFGVRRLDTFIDTTADIGLRAFNTALTLKKEFKSRLELNLISYPLFGFKPTEPERLEVFCEASQQSDFIGGLPERDLLKGHIGYRAHVRNLIDTSLACDKPKPLHIHVDQKNIPSEAGTELVIDVLDTFRDLFPRMINDEPSVWLVHMISPSSYSDERFAQLVHQLIDYNLGVIVCRSAAIGMRQDRSFDAPIHNSIARLPELMVAGVPVRLGTDNINDMYIPSTNTDMFFEFWGLTNDVRYYTPEVLAQLNAKLATGGCLNQTERLDVFESLDERTKQWLVKEGFFSP